MEGSFYSLKDFELCDFKNIERIKELLWMWYLSNNFFLNPKNSCIQSFLNLKTETLWKFEEDCLKNKGKDRF